MFDSLQSILHYVVTLLLAASFFALVWHFLRPAWTVRQQLKTAIENLGKIRSSQENPVTDLEQVAKKAMVSSQLTHCWAEYGETLHPQKEVDEFGQEKIVRWRSTAMADIFFSEQALVETPLKTEFYKHLPGILTGIGIIGTFSGLIFGLMGFQISPNPDVVRASLATLIQNVGQAFILSGSAIALAMFATWAEKSIVTRLYKRVEELCQLIDSLFDAGAGEEYLARLVLAAEESATQSAQMKDSLVTDLKQILTELTEMQIAAAGTHHQQLSSAVVGAINESLKEPMAQLSAGMNSVARDQGTAINTLLTDVLSGFTAKIDDLFGAQMRGMNDALAQTSLAIQSAAGKFDQLASNLDSAGQGAAEAMHERLESMMTAMDARQQAMNHRMGEFVEQLRANLEHSQSESAGKMHTMLAELGQHMASMMTQLQDNAKHSRDEQGAQLSQLAGQMGEFLQRMEQTVASTQDQTTAKLHGLLSSLGEQTGLLISSLDTRNAAALQSQQEASAGFARETQGTVHKLGEQVGEVVNQLNDTAKRSRNEQESQLLQLTGKMGEFLGRMENTVTHTQDQTSAKLQSMLSSLGEQTGLLISTLDARNAAALQSQQEASASFALETQNAVTKLAEQVQQLTSRVEAASGAMRSAVADLASHGREHITQMNRGADTLNTASTRFGNTLDGFSKSSDGVVESSKLLTESAQKLQSAVALSNQALNGHQAAQQTFGTLLDDLKATVENASRDARLTSQLVGTLEAASRQLAQVQEQAESYLSSVNTVLTETHQAFANSIKGTLREGNKDFHTELSKAVDVLRGAILDLGNALETVPAKG